ncbi:hypothetical protein [Ectothiorhodospira variabilis]|uniref:hypothetical protein n=1 Tax=Ectothiorhodospira variabilis TaxID=505694 RepID=UPI001EFB1B02|nr:hypothetical protein [Ectothiorhodospira variabilis]MCG5498884.1 hypothetical protein [Ectothiorhodospira variabilis]
MNVNMPAFNPVMPATTNAVMPTPTDRLEGGGTAVEMETTRPVSDARQTEQGNANPGQNTTQNPPEATNDQAVVERSDAELAAQARLEAAPREGTPTPEGFGADQAGLSQGAANEAPQAQPSETQGGQRGPDNAAGRPDAEQMASRQQQEDLQRAFDVASTQAQGAQSTVNEMV